MAAAPAAFRPGLPRVDLMPRAEVERRDRARLVRGWLWALLGAVAVTVLLVAGAFIARGVADAALAAERARTQELLIELGSFSEVSGALGAQATLEGFRAEAMASDFAWGPVIDRVRSVLPPGVELAGFDLITGPAPSGGEPVAGEGLVGVLTFGSPNAIDIAQLVRSLRTVPGVAAADGRLVSSSQQDVGAYTYEVTVTFDQTIYSGRFAEAPQ